MNWERVRRILLYRTGLRKSDTLFLAYDVGTRIPDTGTRRSVSQSRIVTRPLERSDLENWPRNRYVSVERAQGWVGDGKSCIIACTRTSIVGYAWVHEITCDPRGLGRVSLQPWEAWVGPVYVREGYRGQGLAVRLVGEAMRCSPHLRSFVTAVNRENVRSLRAFLKNGFGVIGCVQQRSIGPIKMQSRVIEWNVHHRVSQLLGSMGVVL